MISIKKVALTALFLSSLGPISVRAASVGFTGNLNGALGIKKLKTGDWDPNEQQLLYGVQGDFRRNEWPISIALDAIGSVNMHKRDGNRITGQTEEFSTGVRKVWDGFGSIAPFIGAGPSIVRAHTESSSSANGGRIVVEDTDWDLGVWLGGGVLFRVTPTFNVGAGVRWSDADLHLFRSDVEAGGMSYMLLAGIHF